LKAAKEAANTATRELAEYQAAAEAWREEAEQKVRAGSRRVDQAEARALQV